MTHYWLTNPKDGLQYIYNPGQPDHGSCSYDGINWDRPVNDAHIALREERMAEIMEAERDLKVKADQQDAILTNMETPEAIREWSKERIEALRTLKTEVDRKTLGEHMTYALGCATFALFMATFALLTVVCIDAIIKIVGAW